MFPFDFFQSKRLKCCHGSDIRFGWRFALFGFLYFFALLIVSIVGLVYASNEHGAVSLSTIGNENSTVSSGSTETQSPPFTSASPHSFFSTTIESATVSTTAAAAANAANAANDFHMWFIFVVTLRTIDLVYSFYTVVAGRIDPRRRDPFIFVAGLARCLSVIAGIGVIVEAIILLAVNGSPQNVVVAIAFYANFAPLALSYSPCSCCTVCCCWCLCLENDSRGQARDQRYWERRRERERISASDRIRRASPVAHVMERSNVAGGADGNDFSLRAQQHRQELQEQQEQQERQQQQHNDRAQSNTMTKLMSFFEGVLAMEDRNCAICISDYEPTDLLVRLSCGHYFHDDCWKACRETRCPICRQDVINAKDLRAQSNEISASVV